MKHPDPDPHNHFPDTRSFVCQSGEQHGAEMQRLLHELEIHQAELELQNDELRRVMNSLEQSQTQFLRLFNQAPVGYLVLDEAGIIRKANETFCRMTGHKWDAVVSKPFTDFIGTRDRDIFRGRFRAFFRSPTEKSIELLVLKADTSFFHSRIEGITVSNWDNEQSGDRNRMLLLTISDITDLRRSHEEREKLERRLGQAQKLEAIGRLAGGVAHDFNNLLSIIVGQVAISFKRLEPGNPVENNLAEIRRAADKSAELIKRLLSFARQQNVKPKVIDLDDRIRENETLLRQLAGENIVLKKIPDEGLCPVMIDPTQLDQILSNLTVNARDSITGTGEIVITTRNVFFHGQEPPNHPGYPPGEYAAISVSDTGTGMNEETIGKIFEPFFTTKEPGRGTGLGLATVYGIMQQNGGFIDVTSVPGRGSTFTCYFPKWTEKKPDIDRTRLSW